MNVDHKCTFQHTATRRWLLTHIYSASGRQNGFNTQPPEGGCIDVSGFSEQILVSTHSRTKAAARHCCYIARYFWFQHTAARRRLLLSSMLLPPPPLVSTHSRAKAAAVLDGPPPLGIVVSTHSRAKAAAGNSPTFFIISACFNTQPREGGCDYKYSNHFNHPNVSTHSRAKAAAVFPH